MLRSFPDPIKIMLRTFPDLFCQYCFMFCVWNKLILREMFLVIFYFFWPGQNGRRHAHNILVTVSFVNTRLDNGLSPKRWQAFFQTNVDLQKIVPLEQTSFMIRTKNTKDFTEGIHLKIASMKRRPSYNKDIIELTSDWNLFRWIQ